MSRANPSSHWVDGGFLYVWNGTTGFNPKIELNNNNIADCYLALIATLGIPSWGDLILAWLSQYPPHRKATYPIKI